MRKQRGFTLVEAGIGIGLTVLLMSIGGSILVDSLNSFNKTDTRDKLSSESALAVRKMTEELRSAVSVTITNSGQTLTYEMPALNGTQDPVTGEFEYMDPIQSDGNVQRYFFRSGTIVHDDGSGNETIVLDEILDIDPDPNSSYYNAPYPMFSYTSVGSTNGLRVILISERKLTRTDEHMRMSTVAQLRNVL